MDPVMSNPVPYFRWHDEESLKYMTRFPTLQNVKTICVTGGAGFIGSWFLRNMAMTYPEYNFVCYDSLDECASSSNLGALDDANNFIFVRGDIRSKAKVRACLTKHNVDVIVHFAANSHVDLSFDSATDFCDTNVAGTVKLLEAAYERRITRFIYVSTDEVYGALGDGEADHLETAPLRPTNPYSGSKAAAEMMVSAFAKSFGLPVLIVRSNNIYGPNQFPEKIIPKFASLILRGEKVPLYGNGTYRRRYLNVVDAANAFNVLMHKGVVGETYNIGSYDEFSNIEIVKRIVRVVQGIERGHPSTDEVDLNRWTRQTPGRPFMDRRYGVDCSKIRALGWSPQVSFEDGLQKTVEWYRRFGDDWWGDVSSHLGAGQFKPRQEVTLQEPIANVDGNPLDK